jgi:hypothetical protein
MQPGVHELRYMKAPTVDDQQSQSSEQRTSDSKASERRHNRSDTSRSARASAAIPWKFEILAWVASCCFFVAIVVVLRAFDGRPLPKLKYGITPNALIGLLSTFAEFLLIVPVQSAIGQLKWLQAMRKRPLNDFRVIDEASRGPWGSLLLLVKRKGGYVLHQLLYMLPIEA